MGVPIPGNTTVPMPNQSVSTAASGVILHRGDSGEAVRTIQQKLASLGYNLGTADGEFGQMTEDAVKAFQAARHLQPNGYIDQETLTALGYQATVIHPEQIANSNVTPDLVARMYPDVPIGNIQNYLPFILNALNQVGLNDKSMVLMALATVKVETGNFAPVDEQPSKFNTSPNGHPFGLYDFKQNIGNQAAGDGERYRGRGFIQLTGRANYANYSQKLGLGDELVNNPDAANDPRIAAAILAAFLKDREQKIRDALAARNFAAARMAINGGTNGLEQFELAYQAGEQILS